VPLDPAQYAIAQSPWPYRTVAAQLTAWGYEPAGDHSEAALLNLGGFLRWEKTDPKTGRKKAFVIASPKWRTHGGKDEPVWPSAAVLEAMSTQEVFQRAGSGENNNGKSVETVMILKRP
jgi:hypothetical protein